MDVPESVPRSIAERSGRDQQSPLTVVLNYTPQQLAADEGLPSPTPSAMRTPLYFANIRSARQFICLEGGQANTSAFACASSSISFLYRSQSTRRKMM